MSNLSDLIDKKESEEDVLYLKERIGNKREDFFISQERSKSPDNFGCSNVNKLAIFDQRKNFYLSDLNSDKLLKLAKDLNVSDDSGLLENKKIQSKLITEIRELFERTLTPSLEDRCPALKLRTSNKRDMEQKGHLKRISTTTPKGKSGSRQESAYEFLARVLAEAGIEKVPYLHEIRAINSDLAKSIDGLNKQQRQHGHEYLVPSIGQESEIRYLFSVT